MKFWLQPGFFEPVKMEGSDFTKLDILTSKTAYFRLTAGSQNLTSLTQEAIFWHNGTWILPEICWF